MIHVYTHTHTHTHTERLPVTQFLTTNLSMLIKSKSLLIDKTKMLSIYDRHNTHEH